MPETSISKYEKSFSKVIGEVNAISFFKARVALYAILKSLGIGSGDEVILPGYTCVVNAAPIKYLGAKPVYVDIEPNTFNINPQQLESKITPKTKVIIAQHTYGYLAEIDEIKSIAGPHGIEVIEDCCLALGSKDKGQYAGTFTKAAYFSSQWNKTYTTGFGGIAVFRDQALFEKVNTFCLDIHRVPIKKQFLLMMELAIYRTMIYPRTTAIAQNLFRWLANKGIIAGSSSAKEITNSMMPSDYFMSMSSVQARSGLRQLKNLNDNILHRKKLSELYDHLLLEKGWKIVKPPPYTEPVLVRYPVRITEKWKAVEQAARKGIELGTWFESPLHSKETNLASFDYIQGMCPEGEKACDQVVNLPLHMRVTEKTAKQTVDFVTRFTQAFT